MHARAPLAPCRLLVAALCLVGSGAAGTASATVVGFDGFANGTLITTQLQTSHGVEFPGGVVTRATAAARSASNVVAGRFNGEFERFPFEARFSADQSQVIVYVEGDNPAGTAMVATLRAYNGSGSQVASDVITLTSGNGWRLMTVGAASSTPNIRRVVVTATQGSFTTNFLIVDDLTFVRATPPPPPPPPDSTPPTLTIWRPIVGAPDFTAPVVPVEVEAGDDTRLHTVTGRIVHVGTGQEVGRMDWCGSAFSGTCPATFLRQTATVSLSPALEGEHRAEAIACDAAGNCTNRQRLFTVDLPDPSADVFVEQVEVNQGVQTSISRAGRPGETPGYSSGVRLVAGRRTVVRFFPLAEGAVRSGWTARMTARITYRDDSMVHRSSMPNAGIDRVDVMPDPGAAGRQDAYLAMRAAEGRALNYVIPATLLAGARLLEVRLEEGSTPITGWVQVGLRREVRLAVKHLRLFGPGIPGGGTPATTAQWRNSFRYVEEAYPISELTVIPSAPARIADDGFCEIFSSDLGCAVWQFSFYDPPGAIPLTGFPTHLMKVGLVPYDAFGRVGVALWGSAIAEAWGDAGYAHEIGHTAGRPHAGGFHGEDGGEAWPFGHGWVGPSDFGVITDEVAAAGSFGLGEWSLTIVDPCPGATVAQRSPMCALADDQVTHDFMSYGWGANGLGPLAPTSFANNWVSSHTWNRLHAQLDGSAARLGPMALTNDRVDALLIDAVVDEHGTVRPLPILRLRVAPEELHAPPPGPYTLKLYGAGGDLLLSRSFALSELHDTELPIQLLGQVVPFHDDLARVVVERQGVTVLDRSASAHPPTVELLFPNGGQTFETGKVRVAWVAEDADGGPVSSRVEYSDDGGNTWGTLGSVGSGEPRELEVAVADLSASGNARFRVVVTDGFATAADASDCAVGVGGPAADECAAGPDPDPPSDQFLISPAVPGFGFQVRITGDGGPITGQPEADCIGETLCVSGALSGRSEVFLRVVGPKPNGKLWPTLVKFSTSDVEVWVRQQATGIVKYYHLRGARPGFDELPGLFDREGFEPRRASVWAPARAVRAAGDEVPPLPGSPAMTTAALPGFRFWVRITGDGGEVEVRQEGECIGETLCVSGALPGRSEAFLRVVGPKPNGRLWPTLVRFTTSTLEVWIEQTGTGERRYYLLPGATPGNDDLTGLFDREGFLP